MSHVSFMQLILVFLHLGIKLVFVISIHAGSGNRFGIGRQQMIWEHVLTRLVRWASSKNYVLLPQVWSAWIHQSSWAEWIEGLQPETGPSLSVLSSLQYDQCTGWSFPVPSHQPKFHLCHSPTASDNTKETPVTRGGVAHFRPVLSSH